MSTAAQRCRRRDRREYRNRHAQSGKRQRTGRCHCADKRLTVRGSSMVGGIAGINRGTLGGTSINCLTNQAAESAQRRQCRRRCRRAGGRKGCSAVREESRSGDRECRCGRRHCRHEHARAARSRTVSATAASPVTTAMQAALPAKTIVTIRSCSVGTDNRVTLITRNKTAAGAICAVNHKGGTVQGATLGDHITISGSAFILGAVVGDNSGTGHCNRGFAGSRHTAFSASTLQVGGAVGINRAGGTVSKVKVTSDFEKFTKYTYLGGVVGQNNASGKVTDARIRHDRRRKERGRQLLRRHCRT